MDTKSFCDKTDDIARRYKYKCTQGGLDAPYVHNAIIKK